MLEMYHQKEVINIQAFDSLARTTRMFLKYFDNYLQREANISPIRFIVLHVLSIRKETTSLSDLVALTNTNHNNITALIDRMKKEGLVIARRSRKDRRVIHVKLTPKGIKLAGESRMLVRDIADQVFSSLGRDDTVEFMRQLSKINQNIAIDPGGEDSLEK